MERRKDMRIQHRLVYCVSRLVSSHHLIACTEHSIKETILFKLIFLPPATKLGQVRSNIFRSVCQEFCSQGGWWYPSMHCRSPRGKLRGLAWGVSRPTSRGFPGPHLVGSPGTHLGGGIPACTEVDTPLPADSYYCERYASYWNAFLSETWANYRLPIKLREGNVFSRFCLSIQGSVWPLPMIHWTSLLQGPSWP